MPENPRDGFAPSGTLEKPGLIGRLVRLGMGIVCLWPVWDLAVVAHGRVLSNPLLWVVAGLGLWLVPPVINLGFARTWAASRIRLVGTLAVAAAAVVSTAVVGTPTGLPLEWVLRAWILYVFGHLGSSFVLASILGTPGCEMRAIPQLIGLFSGRATAEHHCPGFLDGLDHWENARRSE